MTTGDGGMICTNNKKKYLKLKSISFHGWNKDPWLRHKSSLKTKSKNHWEYSIDKLGYKYNMNDLAASIGLAQLKKIRLLNTSREKIIKRYIQGIKNLKNINILTDYKLDNSSYWLFVIRCNKRDALMNYLKLNKISSAVHFEPLPMQPLYKKYKSIIPNAKETWKKIISLPLFPDLKFSEVDYIVNKLKLFDKNYSKY